MRQIFFLVLLFITTGLFAQAPANYTNINGRYRWIAGMFDSTFHIPKGTTTSLRTGGSTNAGALFYRTTDSSVYYYTGTQWLRVAGAAGFVPYTGATQNVNLGQFGLTTKFVQFDTSSQAVTDRRLQWSNAEGTLQFGMTNGATITQRVGLEQFARVRNLQGDTIEAGDVVYISGASGDRAAVKLADNRADSTSSKTLGVATEQILPNDIGLVGTFGVVGKLNLSAFTAGDVVYLDSIPGKLTKVKPQAPYHMVFVGVVERANAGNGLLFVNVQNGYELEELHNVRITSPVRNNGILAYDSVGRLWKDTTLNALGGITGSGTSGQVSYFNGTNSITSSPTFAFTPTSQLLVNNSVTASSAIARGGNISSTLIASANNDVLVGLDINPTFTNGAFTGVGNYGLRVQNGDVVFSNQFGVYITGVNKGLWGNLTRTIGLFYNSNGDILLRTNNIDSRFSVLNNGNILIGTNTDAGFRLDVNGTARVQGVLTGNANINGLTISNNNSNPVIGSDGTNVTIGSNQLYRIVFSNNRINLNPTDGTSTISSMSVSSANNGSVYIGGNANPSAKLQVAGSITATSSLAQGVLFNNTLVAAANNDVLVGLDVNPTFTNGAFTGVSNFGLRVRDGNSTEAQITTTRTAVILGNNSASATNSVNTLVLALPTTNGGNLSIQSGITSGTGLTETPNLDFRNGNGQIFARISSAGTAGNIGRLQIGVSQPSTSITGGAWFYAAANRGSTQFLLGSDFTDNSRAVITAHWDGASALILKPNASTTTAPTFRVRNNTDAGDNFLVYGATGNVGINTTSDAGFRLDVNGTARVQGQLNLGSTANAFVAGPSTSGSALFKTSGGSQARSYVGSWGESLPTCLGGTYVQLGLTEAGTVISVISGAGINVAPNASAQLEIVSTTKGFLAPRMTTAQRDAISTPATGLSVYNTSTNTNDYYNGSAWLNVGQVLVPANNTTGFSISGSSLTGSNAQSLVSLSQTWNTTGNPTAFLLNITNTASGATADLMELQVGGVAQFIVGKSGTIQTTAPAGGTAKPWKLGNVAVVSPTSPDRTIEVEIDGVTYYIHAKTTNN